MTSQEENQALVSQSQPPPMNSEKTNTEANSTPFSIREYVFSRREKNILNSWPFSEKSLQMCLKGGVSINDVLPPFHEPLNAASSNLLHLRHDNNNNKDHVNVGKADKVPPLNEHTQNVINECDFLSNDPSHEEGNQSSAEDAFTLPISSTTDAVDDENNPTLASIKASICKRKRGRERTKIRSMVDILAEARHCTLDEDDLMLNQNTEPIKSKPMRVTRQPPWLKGFVPK